MSKKLMSITVRGKHRTYGFEFYGNPKHLEEWRAEGLDIDEVVNTIPAWIVNAGLVRPWCFLQDVLNFKNPF